MMHNDKAPILVGVDGSELSIDALRYAATLSKALGAPLRVVTVWEFRVLTPYFSLEPDAPDSWNPEVDAAQVLASSIAQAFEGNLPSGLIHELLEGPTVKTLIEESKRAGMLVLGARGTGGIARLLLGSVSAICAEH